MTTPETGTSLAADQVAVERDAFVERLTQAELGMLDVLTVYLGDRLGLYQALAAGGPATPAELASRTGTAERYAREWLEQQAVTGILAVDDATKEAEDRRFRLPPGRAEVLLDRASLSYMAPSARLLVGMVPTLPAVIDAFHSGGGVAYAAYGAEVREGIAAANYPLYAGPLGREWLPAISDVHERLLGDPPAQVADLGCGAGWSSIGIARAYPNALVDGFDRDESSIALARQHAVTAGVDSRVQFHVRDASDPAFAGRYDLALAIECLHDMAKPVEALRTMRGLVGAGGTVLVIDEKAAERFEAPGDDVERAFYGYSVLHCLPVGMADQPSAGTGTVMRPATLRGYAERAGFRDVEILPIDHDTWRFYRLMP